MIRFHRYSTAASSGALPFPKVSKTKIWTAKILGATMWFWMFYRIREEAPHILGWHKPWEHGGHGEEHHQEHHEKA